MSTDKTGDLDEDIRSLKRLLEEKQDPPLKFDERMKIYARLERFYNLRLKYSGSGRGAAFNQK